MAVFVQLTDLHLRPPGVLAFGTVDTDRHAAAAIDAVIRRHADIDAVIVTGDIADLGEEDAYARAAMLLSRFAAPVVVVPGNHDLKAPLAEAFSGFPGHACGNVRGRVCKVATFAGVTVVALDSGLDDLATHHGALGAEQLDWLDATLATAGPTLIALHHPPFDVGIGFMDAIGLADAAAFAAVVARHENVLRIVCGHVHRTIVGEVGGVPVVAVPGVAHQVPLALEPEAPPALVMEPPAYAVHTVTGGRAVTHVAYVDEFAALLPARDTAPA